ncbi:TetR/AcrR family transcriptional regulator [Paenibacillus sp. HWE-109]|uniref:TetR/AcrR family transcriptional regulator n=1 Tax=Paenibacillus sp. HWE-109 TaxID=1306526 RepID=UPI001EDCB64A|nr:TetR/AcrR family transcriptional regulator [Paenibacillus sp. HWE-109]UKS25873.1 TetR/AcrR family transcriptional regulator [Paenibacillus sp. HWE-109]
MQVLKDDVKNSIRQAALSEFKKHGYLKASMRHIADAAGITPGNIYRYFESKDDLFHALIHPIYEQFNTYILEVKDEVESTLCKDASDHLNILRKVDATILRLFKESSIELTILLNLSEGSRFEPVKQELITLVYQILEKVLPNEQTTIQMFAETLIEGVSLILRDHEDSNTIKMLVDELLYLYSAGISEKIKLSSLA